MPSRPLHDINDRRLLWLAALLTVASLAPRLWNFDSPLVGAHEFRQTQTAITVQTMLEAPGFSFPVLNYETPLFGPPWQVPFEFPSYQLSSAVIGRLAPALSVDVACRIAALGWFYLSASLLFFLVRRRVSTSFATATLALYVWSPFSIYWSRAAMIDYCTVALGWLYLSLGLRALEERYGSGWRLVGAAVAGALTSATKVASWPGVALLLGLAWLYEWRRAEGDLRRFTWPVAVARHAASAAFLFGVPLAAGLAWTAWADRLKGAREATRWLVSSELTAWTFGHWSDRWSLDAWSSVAFVPALLVGLAVARPILRRRWPTVWRAAWPAALAAVATASTFLNLYVEHDYYQIAVTPFLAVAVAAGFRAIAGLSALLRVATFATLAVAAVPYGMLAVERFEGGMSVDWNAPSVRLGRLVERVTPPEQWVLVDLGHRNWNPSVLYFAHRRGWMLQALDPGEVDPRYGTLVCDACRPDLLRRWPDRRLVGMVAGHTVYRIAHSNP